MAREDCPGMPSLSKSIATGLVSDNQDRLQLTIAAAPLTVWVLAHRRGPYLAVEASTHPGALATRRVLLLLALPGSCAGPAIGWPISVPAHRPVPETFAMVCLEVACSDVARFRTRSGRGRRHCRHPHQRPQADCGEQGSDRSVSHAFLLRGTRSADIYL
jgi:hypothetical protein